MVPQSARTVKQFWYAFEKMHLQFYSLIQHLYKYITYNLSCEAATVGTPMKLFTQDEETL